MKIRNGFVSNSSSSSFVVAFPKKPKSAKDVQEILFGTIPNFVNPWFDAKYADQEDVAFWPANEVAKIIYRDMKGQKPNSKIKILKAIEGGWFRGIPEFKHYEKEGKIDWDAYYKESNRRAKKIADDFIDENKDTFIYTFEYSDNDGRLSASMEHGSTFDNVPHIKISRH